MLGSLSRKLRIFGFDTLYYAEGSDEALESLARREGRVVLTADKALAARSRAGRFEAILVEGRTDAARLRSLTGLAVGSGGPSRCPECNEELAVIGKRDASGVPPKVLERHRLFFRCPACSKVYWRGSHWTRLRRLSRPAGKALT